VTDARGHRRRVPAAGGRWALRLAALRGAHLLVALSLLASSWAAEPLSSRAEALLAEGRAAVESALLATYPRTPDHPGWREALDLGRRALRVHDHEETRRFLARAYALVGWSVRAIEHFDALIASGASLDDPPGVIAPFVSSARLYTEAIGDLAFSRYQAGDVDAALALYQRWHDQMPDDPEAMRWLARLHLERQDPVTALPFWERLSQLLPQDESVAYHLAEARRGAAVGPVAATAFRDGVRHYEGGELEAALESFEAALAAAPEFADAAVWSGRLALELERPALAVEHWQRAVELRPDDAGARYFLRRAQDQATYGVAAGVAYHAGLEAYDEGAVEAALASFERAVAANDRFTAAWVWTARTRQELGHYDGAVEAWERVLVLDPGDDRASYFLAIVRQQRGVRAEAGAVFAAGILAFERAEFEAAEAHFREAVAIDPSAVQAWVWLGRVTFSLQRFDEAAEAFGRAAALDPSDEDIAYFAAEAARLAAPEPEEGAEEAPPPDAEAAPASEPEAEPDPDIDPGPERGEP
jgi:tetratricopeptide (TPR) repeat protein